MTLANWRRWAEDVRREVGTIAVALGHPGTPWYAKVLAVFVVAYALSPLDLIPDAVPVLGWLDDLLLVPLGLWLVQRMIPTAVLAECRGREVRRSRHLAAAGAALVVCAWAAGAWLLWWLLLRAETPSRGALSAPSRPAPASP